VYCLPRNTASGRSWKRHFCWSCWTTIHHGLYSKSTITWEQSITKHLKSSANFITESASLMLEQHGLCCTTFRVCCGSRTPFSKHATCKCHISPSALYHLDMVTLGQQEAYREVIFIIQERVCIWTNSATLATNPCYRWTIMAVTSLSPIVHEELMENTGNCD